MVLVTAHGKEESTVKAELHCTHSKVEEALAQDEQWWCG
jgi:hypothetical protein